MSERDDRYLWDSSGAPDREVERLERLLGRYRYDPERDAKPSFARRPPRRLRWLALAASLLICGAAALWWSREREGYTLRGAAGVERAGVGEVVATGADESAVLEIAAIGDVRVQPGTSLRIEDAGARHHRLFLERGHVRASIFARPGVFQIGTPAGLSIDLGCVYDVRVDAEGVAHIEVLSGRVAFEGAGKRVVVPAGAECQATRELGPNVPVRVRASAELREAVRRLERGDGEVERELATLLAGDVRDECVSLWHLFRVTDSELVRARLFDVLRKSWPLPDGVSERDASTRVPSALDAWETSVSRDWRGL